MSAAPLVIAAHGSADERFAATVEAVAVRVRSLRPTLDVRVGYLEHGPPHLADVVAEGAVVVPLLLSGGYHVHEDLPAQAPGTRVTAPVGPDPKLAGALADRLTAAGWDGRAPVTLGAAGSADERSLADVRTAAGHLSARTGTDVTPAYISGGQPRVADLAPRVVASYLVAPGAFHDALLRTGAAVVSEPLGDHPAVAAVVLSRYDGAVSGAGDRGQVPGRTAPA